MNTAAIEYKCMQRNGSWAKRHFVCNPRDIESEIAKLQKAYKVKDFNRVK